MSEKALKALVARPAVRRIFAALAPEGGALVVGGAVRDTLLGRAPKDVDLASPVPIDRMGHLLERAGISVVPTGIAHGVLTAVVEGEAFEIAVFRRDVACDGRRAVTAVSRDVRDDAQRRDFTINTLYCTPQGDLLDLVGGRADLAARRIRFVGDAQTRIREDRLRALRFFRFWARIGDPSEQVHGAAIEAVSAFARDLSLLARERIGWEIMSLLSTPRPRPAVACMARQGYWEEILPGGSPAALLDLLAVEEAQGVPADPLVRLTALRVPGAALLLRRPRPEARICDAMAACADIDDPAAAAWSHGLRAARGGVLLRLAEGRPVPAGWRSEMARGADARFPLVASDFPGLSGAELGRALAQARDAWLESGLVAGRAEILESACAEAEMPSPDR